jgi:hypothetical protein
MENVIEKPDGIVISLTFIAGMLVISFVSRLAGPPSCVEHEQRTLIRSRTAARSSSSKSTSATRPTPPRRSLRGVEIDGYRVLQTECPAVPNALAAIMLRIRDETGMPPHLHFQWSEGNPLTHLLRYILLGQGETAPITREILRQAEKDVTRRPVVHVGG